MPAKCAKVNAVKLPFLDGFILIYLLWSCWDAWQIRLLMLAIGMVAWAWHGMQLPAACLLNRSLISYTIRATWWCPPKCPQKSLWLNERFCKNPLRCQITKHQNIQRWSRWSSFPPEKRASRDEPRQAWLQNYLGGLSELRRGVLRQATVPEWLRDCHWFGGFCCYQPWGSLGVSENRLNP